MAAAAIIIMMNAARNSGGGGGLPPRDPNPSEDKILFWFVVTLVIIAVLGLIALAIFG